MAAVLLAALWLGLTSAGLTVVLRNTPGLDVLTQAGKRPLACDVCMSLWTTLLLAIFTVGYGLIPWLAWPPAFALAKFALARITDPVGAPPLPGQWTELEETLEPEKGAP